MKFLSNVPIKYKENVVSCLIDRAQKICSSVPALDKQIKFLRDFFTKNGFPLHFFEEILAVMRRKFSATRRKVLSVEKKIVYLKIPFVGPDSYNIKKEISKLVSRHYPQVSLRVILHNNNTIGKMFPFKDRVPEMLRSLIVYKYSCSECAAVYIGQTKRHFDHRICEHRGLKFRSGLPSERPPFSSIREHALNDDHVLYRSSFTVLARANNEYDLSLMEKLLINKYNPSLNRQH